MDQQERDTGCWERQEDENIESRSIEGDTRTELPTDVGLVAGRVPAIFYLYFRSLCNVRRVHC